MDDSSYYVPSVVMALALVLKAPAVAGCWRDPLLRSVCALLTSTGLVFFFAAPPTIEKVNGLTGITNVSAPLVYCLLSASSASCLVLVVHWRGGPPELTHRLTKRVTTGYGVVIAALLVLFVLGSAPVERPRDFDTYYADTPFIRQMILLYLAAMTVAALAMNVMCWRWALQVHGWLRAGLLIIMAGCLCNLGYVAAKVTALVTHWCGGNLDVLSTYTAPELSALGAQISAVGFCLPLACQRVGDSWTTWSTYRRLGPLWRELRPVSAHTLHEVRISWWSAPELQMTQRESDIHDGMLGLYPYFDDEVRARSYEAAVAAGSDPVQARAEADAAMVAAAVRARTADPEGRIISAAEANADGASDQRPRDLVRMSMALRESPIVAAVRGRSGEPLP